MWWLYLYVGLGAGGVIVLGVLGVRVFVEVQGLARQIGRSSDDLTRAAERLRAAAEPLARQAGDVARR